MRAMRPRATYKHARPLARSPLTHRLLRMADTREYWRFHLPHWEVVDRPHFVTIRCAGTLPKAICAQISAIHANLQVITPASPEFVYHQRHYFRLTERYLDAAATTRTGFVPLSEATSCRIILNAWKQIQVHEGWNVTHAVAMHNHVHFILRPMEPNPLPLRTVLRQFKGRTARLINQERGRTGTFWQTDWFDRWLRNEEEETRVIDYIRNNPVKAGLSSNWQDWPWRIDMTAPPK